MRQIIDEKPPPFNNSNLQVNTKATILPMGQNNYDKCVNYLFMLYINFGAVMVFF